MKNKKSINYIITIAVLVFLIVGGVFFLKNNEKENNNVIQRQPNIVVESEDEYSSRLSEHYSNIDINQDYVGQLYFDSSLIDLPFVQGKDNDQYLRTDWKTGEYNMGGSVFMDYECTLNSQNIVIYGHYIYKSHDPDSVSYFSPLSKLSDEENYEENKIINLFLGDEVRRYQIASVYFTELKNINGVYYPEDELKYYTPNFSDSYFEIYKNAIKNKECYDTGVGYDNTNHYLTLQTCVEDREDVREIVLCKEIERIYLKQNND